MNTEQNYYHILHIQSDAPHAVIKASYRAQMQKLKVHPDLGGDGKLAAKLNEAYAILSCEHKRAAYDRQLNKQTQRTQHKSNVYYLADKRAEKNSTTDCTIANKRIACQFCGVLNSDRKNQDDDSYCTGCNSPLSSCTSHLRSREETGRALKRQLHFEPVKCFTYKEGYATVGMISNLSPLGLQLQLSQPLNNNQVIKLESDVLTAIAQVKYCKKDTIDDLYVIGVEFLTSRFKRRCGTFFSEEVY